MGGPPAPELQCLALQGRPAEGDLDAASTPPQPGSPSTSAPAAPSTSPPVGSCHKTVEVITAVISTMQTITIRQNRLQADEEGKTLEMDEQEIDRNLVIFIFVHLVSSF